MTVYRYTADRAELHALMVKTVVAGLAFTPCAGLTWREQLETALSGLYWTMRDNPAIVGLMVGHEPLYGSRLDRMRESLLDVVGGACGNRRDAITAINLMTACVVGIAAAEAARSRRSPGLEQHLDATGNRSRTWLEPLADADIRRAIRGLVDQVPLTV